MLNKIFFLIFFTLALTFPALAQDTKTLTLPKPTPTPQAPPGNIELLDGYTHTRGRGIDSRVGAISKPEGMTIRYDIGDMAGQYTSKCSRAKDICLWYKSQKVGGREVYLALTKEGEIIATFPQESANFFAQTKSPENVADFLLMILTYKVGEMTNLQNKTQVSKPK
jgi:hypothetical protein